jgi:hypothetical protein
LGASTGSMTDAFIALAAVGFAVAAFSWVL